MLKNISTAHRDFIGAFTETAKKGLDMAILSFTCEINESNPMSIYAASADSYRGNRFLWRSPSNDVTLVGLGTLRQFVVDHSSTRATALGREWRETCSKTTTVGSAGVYASPIVFGGFPYDPMYQMSGHWSHMKQYQWRIPCLLFSLGGPCPSLTFNVRPADYCTAQDAWSDILTIVQNVESKSTECTTQPQLLATELGDPVGWEANIEEIVRHLRVSEFKKVTLARSMELQFSGDVHAEHCIPALLEHQHGTYVFALESGECAFVGATPRLLFRKNLDELMATCLAGSISRGLTAAQDTLLGSQLLNDAKNKREHRLSVEAMYTKLSSLAQRVSFPDGPTLMKLRDIQHLYTPIYGKVKPSSSAFDFVDSLLYGENSDWELGLVREYEGLERGLYGGPIGWVDAHGNGEIAVSLRCALLHRSKAYLYAGCGIVEDSNASEELSETVVKFRTMLESFRR